MINAECHLNTCQWKGFSKIPCLVSTPFPSLNKNGYKHTLGRGNRHPNSSLTNKKTPRLYTNAPQTPNILGIINKSYHQTNLSLRFVCCSQLIGKVRRNKNLLWQSWVLADKNHRCFSSFSCFDVLTHLAQRTSSHPRKLTFEPPKWRWMEDECPFYFGDEFQVNQPLVFGGVTKNFGWVPNSQITQLYAYFARDSWILTN